MSDLDAFRTNLGATQGRVQADSGEVRFVLGEIGGGNRFVLVPGDYAEVAQTTDLTDVTLVRARLTLRVPADSAAAPTWEASIVLDGVKLARTACEAGRSRVISDLAANVSKHTGMHDVGVRLELVST